jgi:ribose-phosphate pyrophosphokinase
MDKKIVLLAGKNSIILAQEIAKKIEIPLTPVKVTDFADGEFEPWITENIRGAYVFIIQSTNTPAENMVELLLLLDACKRGSALKTFSVIPYYGYARQDRKNKARLPIGAKLMAKLIETSGSNHTITMDLHSDQIQGFFDTPVDHLYSSAIFVPYIESLGIENVVFASPDAGGSKRAAGYAKYFHSDMVLFYKGRPDEANKINNMKLIGDVRGKNVIILDDMIDTGGTLTQASVIIIDNGALSVRAMCTHPVLSGNVLEKIEKSPLVEVVVTDTISSVHQKISPKIKILSTASLFAETIRRTKNNESVSSLFVF